MDVEWIANNERREVMLKFRSDTMWRKFCQNFGEFLEYEEVDEWGEQDE